MTTFLAGVRDTIVPGRQGRHGRQQAKRGGAYRHLLK